ncbi:MAG: hypothetical protein JXA44_01350 [Methanospirillaceae archaeon]|nr:hypothetical protein [Methanospirillaceae archaeon]
MQKCDYCGKDLSYSSAFTCSYCNKTFCPDHRLPFVHDCTGIKAWRQSTPDSRLKKKVIREDTRIRGTLIKRDTIILYICLSFAIGLIIGLILGKYLF